MNQYYLVKNKGTRFIKAGETPVVEQVNAQGVIEWALYEPFKQSKLYEMLTSLSPMIKEVPDPLGGRRKLLGYGEDVILLIKNIVFIGNNHYSDEKRIEIPARYKDIYFAAKAQNKRVLILGYYEYKYNEIFAVFDTEDYVKHSKIHQSAGWIYTTDIVEATVNNYYQRVDKNGNHLYVMNKATFTQYLAKFALHRDLPFAEETRTIQNYFSSFFSCMPKDLVGIDCYEEMKKASFPQWRQSRWEGWYPEFLLQKYLDENPTESIVWWGKKGRGEIDLDMKFPKIHEFYGDAKSDNEDGVTQGNKKETIEEVLSRGGLVWYIVFQWTREMDKDNGGVTTLWWNTALNDPNEHVPDRPKALDTFLKDMKHSIHITRMEIYEIDAITFPYMHVYLPTKCNGKERAPKVEIKKKDRDRFRIFVQETNNQN